MCVTNTTHRRPAAVAFPAASVGVCPSMISQRLMSTLPAAVRTPVYAPQSQTTPMFGQVNQEKPRPKRRRKPQKPGKTAKMNDRHFVVHNYHDHAFDEDEHDVEPVQEDPNNTQRRRGGVAIAFPVKLHTVLEQVQADGLGHIVSWMLHGRCFVIHDSKQFVDHVMPTYFRQTKLTSFQRQLNLYGFCRLTRGDDAGGYYNELFLRGKQFLCKQMVRTKVKGTRFKAASSPEQEPDFYTMAPVVISPANTSDEEMSQESEHTQETVSMFPQGVASMMYEPVPIHYNAPQMQQQQPISFSPIAQAPSFPLVEPMSLTDADRVLDDAVDELFLVETGVNDSLADFVQDWDPSGGFGAVLEDDIQLGFMLEKLLED